MLLVVMLVASLAACSTPVEINEAGASGDGLRLTLGLNSCHGTYDVTVDENSEAVVITVTDRSSPIRVAGDDCADAWRIELSEPLGDRPVIDGQRGVALTVIYEPWNQQRFTEAEYRAALDATIACIIAAEPEAEAGVVEGPDGPWLDVEYPDVPDGESRFIPTSACSARHLDPLRR